MSGLPFWLGGEPLVLASGSMARRAMLEAAGIPVEVAASGVNERAVEAPLLAQGAPPTAIAAALATAKARSVSLVRPGCIVLGGDQLLTCDGRILHKAGTADEAAARLAGLSGRTHELHSAFALIRDGGLLAERVVTARLAVRPLTPGFIAAYVGALDRDSFASVGAYRMEELGAQLFDTVEGDHFTILGLPLFAVLAALRDNGLLLR
jgi:septum formation protein